MDGFTGFKTATTEELPDAVTVMDPCRVPGSVEALGCPRENPASPVPATASRLPVAVGGPAVQVDMAISIQPEPCNAVTLLRWACETRQKCDLDLDQAAMLRRQDRHQAPEQCAVTADRNVPLQSRSSSAQHADDRPSSNGTTLERHESAASASRVCNPPKRGAVAPASERTAPSPRATDST